MTENISFSVVIPVFDSPIALERALKSVASQIKRPDEVIIVNDASVETTAAVYDKIAENFSLFVNTQVIHLAKNVGPGHARQAGINRAQYEFIALLDCDDFWHPKKLLVCSGAIQTHNADLIGHERTRTTSVSDYAASEISGRVGRLSSWSFLIRNPIPTSSIVARRSLCHDIFAFGGRRSEDYAALLILRSRIKAAHFINASFVTAFKAPFGVSGAGSDIFEMKFAALRNCRKLHRKGYISKWEFMIITAFWALKFPVVLLRGMFYSRGT